MATTTGDIITLTALAGYMIINDPIIPVRCINTNNMMHHHCGITQVTYRCDIVYFWKDYATDDIIHTFLLDDHYV